MSIKLRVQYKIHYLKQFLQNMSLPAWMVGKAAKLVVLVLLVVVSVGYMAQVNTLSTSGYVIRDLQDQMQQISDDTEKINEQVASYQSMNSIQNRLANLGLVTSTNISFLKVQDSLAVAER